MPYNGRMKTEVYSVRLTPRLKSELEEVARDLDVSPAERQGLLHEAALQFIGAIEGDRPDRTENARAEVRARVARQHGR